MELRATVSLRGGTVILSCDLSACGLIPAPPCPSLVGRHPAVLPLTSRHACLPPPRPPSFNLSLPTRTLAEAFTVNYYHWSSNGTAGEDDTAGSYDVSTKMN